MFTNLKHFFTWLKHLYIYLRYILDKISIKEVLSMKKTYFIRTIITISLIFTLTACEKEEKKVTIKEPGKTITIIDDTDTEEIDQKISVEKIDRYEKVNITDWLDEDTVVVSKENETLDKMSLAELSEHYPMSLYLFDLTTKEYKLVKEQKDVFLGGADLSADKKYLLYYEYSLGDPVFYVMNMETLEGFGIMGDPIGGAISAKWSDNDTVIGAAYSGGVYLADSSGKITLIDELKEEALYLVEKINDNIYYNTTFDGTLMKLNLDTKEKVSLNLDQVYDTIPSPDGKQMLILQTKGAKNSMLAYDLESGENVIIAEGAELNGVSWSPDQRRIAYYLKEDENNTTVSSLYVYDMLTGVSTQIAVDVENPSTSWSPSGDKLAYTEWDGTEYYSSIIYLK
jgi:TolB protein